MARGHSPEVTSLTGGLSYLSYLMRCPWRRPRRWQRPAGLVKVAAWHKPGKLGTKGEDSDADRPTLDAGIASDVSGNRCCGAVRDCACGHAGRGTGAAGATAAA